MTTTTTANVTSTLDTILTLPAHTTANEIADACRDAYLTFLNESERWGKADLAMWLMGPYEQVLHYVAPLDSRRSTTLRPPSLNEIDARVVERLLETVRTEVMAALAELRDSETGTSFAFGMLAAGLVIRCEDAMGNVAFIPTSTAKRLVDRVLSLIGVDYLMRANDFEMNLNACTRCGIASFDGAAPCVGHGSGIYFTGERITEIPEGA
ncbi:MAG: hypothetical protein KF819_08590 [Labilithrix sp.]|nr:hypothetical protein [Labilithrix sp.]